MTHPIISCELALSQPPDGDLDEILRRAAKRQLYGPKPQHRPGMPRAFDPYEDEWGNQLEED